MANFAEIVSVIYPTRAAAGDKVNVKASVRNIRNYTIYITVAAQYHEGPVIYFEPEYYAVGAGQTYIFTGSFAMPNKTITLYIWSYYWTGSAWQHDDTWNITITLQEVLPPDTLDELEITSYGRA